VARDQHERRAPGLGGIRFAGSEAAPASFREDVIAGLSRPQKSIPPKYFYDAQGSRLFARICRLREYYVTRAELALTREHLAQIARFAGKGSTLIEYGSGESLKTRLLLRALRPSVYLPVDISRDALHAAARRLQREFPWLGIVAVRADFSAPLSLPPFRGRGRPLVYFPGSTIGNLEPQAAQAFLSMTRGQIGASGAMLVGVDLKKDANRLHAAYNDAPGVTAAFNLNVLARANRELGASFDLRRFRHYAFYNAPAGRIEMHLVSLERQSVRIGRHRFTFERGETIHTESSYKYSAAEFGALAAAAGFRPKKLWTDREKLFSLHGLVAV
jgi:L-histidine Nalpha-methyltransferase